MISGKYEKLNILQDLLQKKGENSRRFLNCIYTGNVDEKIRILTETGHLSLALLTSKIHSKPEYEETIIENTKAIGKDLVLNEEDVRDIQSRMKVTVPLKPIISLKNRDYHSNWVAHTEIKRAQQSNIDNILNQEEATETGFGMSTEGGLGFNFGRGEEGGTPTTPPAKSEQKKKVASKWTEDEDEEEDEDIKRILEEKSKNAKNVIQSLTIAEDDNIYQQHSSSSLPGIQTALGNFKMTFNYLKSQLGITHNFESLKGVMKDIYMSSYAHIQFIPCVPVNEFRLRQGKGSMGSPIYPQNGVSIKSLQDKLELGYDMVTENNMPEALKFFQDVIKSTIFFVASDKSEESKVKEIISTCTEYIYLTRLSAKAEESKSDKVKYAEVCCIMTTCNLNVSLHKFLIYKKAKAACKAIKNFITALVFIKKMISFEKELGDEFGSQFEQAKVEFDNFQKIGTNQHNLQFNVNENLPNARQFFDSQNFGRLDLGSKSLKCPLCQSVSSLNSKGQVCGSCNLCSLGEEVLGLKFLESYD